jgi:hypothetical protein
MSKPKSTPMNREAVRRIASATSKQNGGKTPAGSHAALADALVQRRESAAEKKKS